jgi:hypothetical protein
MTVSITTKPNASRRTKTRVREHGPVFIHQDGPKPVHFQNDGSLWIRVEAPDGWMGWLPAEEIEVA